MNYGVGGLIESHTDVTTRRDGPYNRRLVSYMVYLSSRGGPHRVAGGRTVFPMLGLAVEPEPGAALLWYNLSSDGQLDTRAMHLGCPVLHGSKWICLLYTSPSPRD